MKNYYFYGLSALGMILGACSKELPAMPEEPQIADVDRVFYVNMQISGDISDGTRSSSSNGTPDASLDTDFSPGSENAVNNAYFVFYDEDGNVVGDIVPIELSDANWDYKVDNGNNVDNPQGNTVERSYKSTVPVGVRKGEKTPTQVVCYINPISPSTLQNPLNVIQTIARDRISSTVNTTEYFAMSNSVYYPEGEAANDEPVIAVPLENKLYKTEKEAEEALKLAKGEATGEDGSTKPADESGLVQIYVERYAAKLVFNQPAANNIEAYKTATRVYNTDGTYSVVPVTLTFTPQYWALNAESKTTYVIKSFRQESNEGQIMASNYTYGLLNGRINPITPGKYDDGTLSPTNAWDWNNPNYHRSYWSVSPAYFQSSYPEVASDVKPNQINQTYLRFQDLPTKGYAANVNSPKYFKETTVGTKALGSDNPAAAMPSVIFVGRYGVGVNNAPAVSDQGFYTYLSGPVNGVDEDRPYVYFENQTNSAESKVAGGESMLKRFIAQTTILFKANTVEGTTTYSRYTLADMANLISVLAVSPISEDVKLAAGEQAKILKLPANARSLQFKEAPSEDANIWIATGNGYRQIVADDVTNFDSNTQVKLSVANATLMQQVGYAYYYFGGNGYFNIPVKHLGWYRAANENNKPNATFDWDKVRVGDFGMVRNHSYQIQVNSIKGLASGIAGNGEDDYIVPPANTDTYHVAYSVRILKWAVVPVQGVDL